MAIWDEFESSQDEYEEEHVNISLKASTKASKSQSDSEPNSDSDEVFYDLTCSELEIFSAEILGKSQKLQQRYKNL